MTIIEAFASVWTELVDFLVELFPSIIGLFYDSTTGLTFIGVMAVIMGGISLLLLVWNLIRSFFVMHG